MQNLANRDARSSILRLAHSNHHFRLGLLDQRRQPLGDELRQPLDQLLDERDDPLREQYHRVAQEAANETFFQPSICKILQKYFHYLIFNLGSFLPKDACKSCRSRQELSQRAFTCKNRRRYSRERASRSVEVIPTGRRKIQI